MEKQWPRENIITFPTQKTCIDHMWTTRKTINRGAIVKTGVERIRKDYTSSHYMIGARINFTRLMGTVQNREINIYKGRE